MLTKYMIFSIVCGFIVFIFTMITLYIYSPKIILKNYGKNYTYNPIKMIEISILIGSLFTLAIFMLKPNSENMPKIVPVYM